MPKADWAKALGCSERALRYLRKGNTSVAGGPLAARLIELVESLRDGRSRWRRVPGKPGHPRYELVGQKFTPPAVAMAHYRIDFVHGTLLRDGGFPDGRGP